MCAESMKADGRIRMSLELTRFTAFCILKIAQPGKQRFLVPEIRYSRGDIRQRVIMYVSRPAGCVLRFGSCAT